MFYDPQFWVLIAFIIFILAIFKPVSKILKTNLDIKIKEIGNSIDEVEKIKKEAQKTLSEIKKRQNEVMQEILIISQKTKEKISKIEESTNQKLDVQIKKINELTKVKIDQITRDINLEIQQYVVQNSINVTLAILEKKLDKEEKLNLINQSIADLKFILKS